AGTRHSPYVLHNISFEAEPGMVIGIFGLTGSGKSSLLSLIPRFYDPQHGRILADGVDTRDLDLDSYRRQIGIVYQETFLFSNTSSLSSTIPPPRWMPPPSKKSSPLCAGQ